MRTSLFFGLIGLLVLVAACTSVEGTGRDSPTMQDTVDPIEAALAGGAPLKEVRMTARQFEFEPASVTVNQGDVVKLIMYSEDVDHGIAIPDYRVDLAVPVGQEHSIMFLADRSGNFPFYCNVYCGAAHSEMRGLLVVE